jgi:3'-phosphoadenosine 5'-phosphosulfate sulfotransferase (PAPS reductase)/FAD synthetase
MKHIVSYSGGLGSFMAAYHCQQQGWDFELVFCDTLSEDLDLYRFLNETAAYFGKRIITLCHGTDIWQTQIDSKLQASSQKDNCSRILKRELFKKHMRLYYKPDEATLVLGIGAKEKHRTADFQKNHAPYKVIAPLTDMPDVNNESIIDILADIGIAPPRLYDFDFPHNNCGGFCVKSGQKQAALLLKSLPENYKWHEEKQERMFAEMGFARPTIRKTVDGEMT